MKRMTNSEKITRIQNDRDLLLNQVREKIQEKESTLTSNIDASISYSNESSNNTSLEKAKAMIAELALKIASTNDISEVIKLRKKINYYINKIKKELKDRNVSESLYNNYYNSAVYLRKDIARYIRYLKRDLIIDEIIRMNLQEDLPDVEKKRLKILLRNEMDYNRRNLKASNLVVESENKEKADDTAKEVVESPKEKLNDTLVSVELPAKKGKKDKKALYVLTSLALVGSLAGGYLVHSLTNLFSRKNALNDSKNISESVMMVNSSLQKPNTIFEDTLETSSVKSADYRELPKEDFLAESTVPKESETDATFLTEDETNKIVEASSLAMPVSVQDMTEEEKLNYVLEKEGLIEFEFFEIVSTLAGEGGRENYDECYDLLVSMRNRTISSAWVNECARYTGLDGTSIYSQVIWRSPYIQYAGYVPGVSGYDAEELRYTQAYYAAIDFFLSGEKFYEVRTHDYKCFNTPGYAPEGSVQLNPGGNEYYSLLKESELTINDIQLVRKK